MNLPETLKLKFPNVSFREDIILQDDGQGPYIKEWNLDIPKPEQSTIDKWTIELELQYRQEQARLSRIYPTWQEQLDMQYHDALENTTVWQDTITAIKAAYPIPEE